MDKSTKMFSQPKSKKSSMSVDKGVVAAVAAGVGAAGVATAATAAAMNADEADTVVEAEETIAVERNPATGGKNDDRNADAAETRADEAGTQEETVTPPAPADEAAEPVVEVEAHEEDAPAEVAARTPEAAPDSSQDETAVAVEESVDSIDSVNPDEVAETIVADEPDPVEEPVPAGPVYTEVTAGTIYTINGEEVASRTLIDDEGNEFVVVDINGDGIYDEMVTADGSSHEFAIEITDESIDSGLIDVNYATVDEMNGVEPADDSFGFDCDPEVGVEPDVM